MRLRFRTDQRRRPSRSFHIGVERVRLFNKVARIQHEATLLLLTETSDERNDTAIDERRSVYDAPPHRPR